MEQMHSCHLRWCMMNSELSSPPPPLPPSPLITYLFMWFTPVGLWDTRQESDYCLGDNPVSETDSCIFVSLEKPEISCQLFIWSSWVRAPVQFFWNLVPATNSEAFIMISLVRSVSVPHSSLPWKQAESFFSAFEHRCCCVVWWKGKCKAPGPWSSEEKDFVSLCLGERRSLPLSDEKSPLSKCQ